MEDSWKLQGISVPRLNFDLAPEVISCIPFFDSVACLRQLHAVFLRMRQLRVQPCNKKTLNFSTFLEHFHNVQNILLCASRGIFRCFSCGPLLLKPPIPWGFCSHFFELFKNSLSVGIFFAFGNLSWILEIFLSFFLENSLSFEIKSLKWSVNLSSFCVKIFPSQMYSGFLSSPVGWVFE